MPNNTTMNSNQSASHVKGYWAIIIVVTIAVLAGGAIYFLAQDNQLQDDIYSISFTSPVHINKTTKKPAVKKVVPSVPAQQ